MKIKKFNEIENSIDFRKNLYEFCHDHLVYLIDDGLDIEVAFSTGYSRGLVNLCRVSLIFWDVKKSYNDIKDYLIPFLQILDKQYELFTVSASQMEIDISGYDTIYVDIKQLINDEIGYINSRKNFLRNISFRVRIT